MSEVDLGSVRRQLNVVSSEITTVGSQVMAVQTAVGTLEHAIESLGEEQQATQATIAELRDEFASFSRRAELAQHRTLAQTKLIEVRQLLQRDFGHYDAVRRSAVGMLEAMDSGLVRPVTVRELSEELMLTTPHYWLAPALVGLGAWLRDDHELGRRAVGEALTRDRDKSALFFLLVLQRQRRDAAVARWVEHYLANLEPEALVPEFRIVLDATTTGLFAEAARARVADTVRRWITVLGAQQRLVGRQVERWVTTFEGLRTPAPDSPALREYSPDWPRLAALSARATVFAHAVEFLDTVLGDGHGPDPDLEPRVDAVLERLTTDFDREEAPLRLRAAELEAVVEHDGDVEAARRSRAGAASPDATADFLSLLGDAALDDDTVAPPSTRRLAVAVSRPWAIAATDRIEAGLREAHPRGIMIRHDGWHGVLDESTRISALHAGAHEHHARRTAAEVAGVRLAGSAWATGFVALLATALGILSILDGPLVVGVVLLVVAVVAALRVVSEVRALPDRRARILADGDRRQKATKEAITATVAAVGRWLAEFETAVGNADVLRGRLEALDVDDHLGRPAADQQPALAR
ncbi:MAG: hypothetical protein QOE59_3771 [Actinomycetota bacterium]|jgi:hypothetical protein|nr:hypothetical protein [Actinomycetota bacterium]